MLSQPVPVPGRDKIIPNKPKAYNSRKENKETKNKKNNQQRKKTETEKEEQKRRTKGEKGKNRKRRKFPNIEFIENWIQFRQFILCGISDCEKWYIENQQSGNEDYGAIK